MNHNAAIVHIFLVFQKRMKPFPDIFVETASKLLASGQAVPMAAVD